MEMWSIWRVLSGIVLISLAGCSSRSKRVPVDDHPETPVAAPLPATPNAPEPVAEDVPSPSPAKERKVLLMLGPGMAHALAHIGVLKAFKEQHVELCGIYATEFAAWIAGLYGLSPSVNKFEWEAHRIRGETVFGGRDGLASWFGSSVDVAKLEAQLRAQFGAKTLDTSVVPVLVGVANAASRSVEWHDRGSVAAWVHSSLAIPGIIPAVSVDGVKWNASSIGRNFPTNGERDARFASADCVPVWVGVHSAAAPFAGKDRALVEYSNRLAGSPEPTGVQAIRPVLKEFGFFEWSKRNAMIYRGKEAALKWIREFRNP